MTTSRQLDLKLESPVESPPHETLSRLITAMSDFFGSTGGRPLVKCRCCKVDTEFAGNYVTYSFEGTVAHVIQLWVCPRCGKVRDVSYNLRTVPE